MFGGGGGMNSRKMQQMMKQMGIDMDELDAEKVVVTLEDEELVFRDVDVTRMDAQGQQTYQVVGDPERRERGAGDADEADESADEASAIPDADVEIVAQRAGVPEDEARQALEDADGDLAAAVSALEE